MIPAKDERVRNHAAAWLVVMLTFFFNNETLSNNLCLIMSQPCRIAAALGLAVLAFQTLRTRELPAWQMVLTALLVLNVAVVGFRDIGRTNGYFLVLMNLALAYSITVCVDPQKFRYLFVRFMTVISGVSLVCTYLLKPLLSRMPLLFPVVYNSVGYGFIDAHLCYVMKNAGYYRNYGLFREPGVFAIFLCLALLFVLCSEKNLKHRGWTILLLTAGIISTFSTTGYLAAMAITAIWLVKDRKRFAGGGTWLTVILAVLMVLGFLWISDDNLITDVFEKLSGTHSSMRYRLETIINGLRVSWKHYFLGVGILRGTEQMRALNMMSKYHNTSTIITMLVYFGLPALCIYVGALGRFCRRVLGSGLYMLPLLFLLNAQQFIYNPIWYALVLYGMIVPPYEGTEV